MDEFGAQQILPEIDFRTMLCPRSVIADIAAIARESGSFEVEPHLDAMSEIGFDVTNFRPIKPVCHEGFGGQLIARPDRPSFIIVEMRATWWSPDPPTREIYCSEARQMFGPLLKAFNQANGTHFRLRVERKNNLMPSMTPLARQLFDRFSLLANKQSLHPMDWTRFYDFVSRTRKRFEEQDIRHQLIEKGFTEEKADRLADVYCHLWAFKHHR
jgi:hypothetical protein